jgi:hypothetical protein
MRNGNATICHHDHQIPQAQFEARVPAHAQNDDLSVEVPSFEQIFDRDECISSSSPSTLAFAPVNHDLGSQLIMKMGRTARTTMIQITTSIASSLLGWQTFG